ncbi:2-amino-4-hydroxy-6-hydroxymethyldihydropteridine diphosphokinase [Desulfosarcina ovata]|uniref:2-amino-4-hydroxy-6-hydroxymethyldihydropteridine pyrophosphokinase n=1 Tax=Desulfosarcina ovata subsp. ovata TaxID=2752305 RepID=A0A5K8A8N0_9BACT|nr:2-amino-4-hydroxy-6-hydroxymethyldihydropteridine diphosphokinase [Desulfosarcina ovata]BBO88992.1 2-amino-4-hydroxy-6-hydroxymethyldihydropteridine diphosphokinase [Desulfosarcina ovata subsp. ovata]
MAALIPAHTVLISVGSNLGDKLDNCLQGITALTKGGLARLEGVSRFYRTSPVDYTDQDWFVNAAVKITTNLAPPDLLRHLLAIQQQMGRKSGGIRFGPRVLDLDILLIGDRVMRSPDLEIPHPRMHKRAFVLQPICDIDPAVIHPVLGRSVADLLNALDDADQQIVPLAHQPMLTKGGLS